jgi:hypothetical protein
MNEQDKQISSLTIKSLSERVGNEATQSATLEALYTVTAMELEQIKNIINSNEELKAKFEQVKGQMTNGN